jgi:hypothetical protein
LTHGSLDRIRNGTGNDTASLIVPVDRFRLTAFLLVLVETAVERSSADPKDFRRLFAIIVG